MIEKIIKLHLAKILFVILLVLIFFFLSFRIEVVPPGLNGDEASIGYNAILISENLRDENDRFLPIFIHTLDKTDWKQPVTIYTTAIFFKIFGPSYFLLRVVSIFFILLSCFLIFLVIKELINEKFAFIGVIIFATSPIILIQSHLALENIAPLPFVIFWLLMIAKFTKRGHHKFLILAGISLGLSFYSYNGMRLTMPVFVLLTHVFLVMVNKKDLKLGLFFLVGWLPFILILPLIKSSYPGSLFGNARPVEIQSLQELIYPFLSTFDISFTYFKGDATPYHSTGKYGLFLIASLPGFLIGVYQTIKNKNPLNFLIMGSFFLSPLLFGWVGSVHRGSRLLILVPLYTVITSYGFYFLWISKHIFFRKSLIIMLILFGAYSFYDFARDYFIDYSGRVKEKFPSEAHIAYNALHFNAIKRGLTPVIEESIRVQENIVGVFFEKTYYPNPLKVLAINDTVIPKDSIILASSNHLKFLDLGYEEIKLETEKYSLYLK